MSTVVTAERLRGRDGGYAPTLRTLLEQRRFTRETEALLDEFSEWLIGSPLIVGDLHIGNIVLAHDEEHGERLVLVDGMGEKNLIPLNTFFPGLNRTNTRDRLKRMRQVIARRLAVAERAAPPAPAGVA